MRPARPLRLILWARAILGDLALGPPARVARRADAGLIPTQRFVSRHASASMLRPGNRRRIATKSTFPLWLTRSLEKSDRLPSCRPSPGRPARCSLRTRFPLAQPVFEGAGPIGHRVSGIGRLPPPARSSSFPWSPRVPRRRPYGSMRRRVFLPRFFTSTRVELRPRLRLDVKFPSPQRRPWSGGFRKSVCKEYCK